MLNNTKIGLGTSLYGRETDYSRHISLLEYSLDIGYRLFDTGETYSEGNCEKLLGNVLSSSRLSREDYYISSKTTPFRIEDLTIKCKNSLDRLQTDYIDIYFLHWLEPFQKNLDSIKIIIELFVNLKENNFIKHFGLSNFTIDELNLWKQAEANLGINILEFAQYRYNLILNSADAELNNYVCNELKLKTMFHSPFGGGHIAGYSRPPLPKGSYYGDFWEDIRIKKLSPLAVAMNISVPQLILLYLHRWDNSIAIPKSFNKEHLKDNFTFLEHKKEELDPRVIKYIEKLFPLNSNS